MTPSARFSELLQDIEPSSTTKSNAISAHTALRNYLRLHSDYKDLHVETYLSGSYKRDTAIRPKIKDGMKDRPDVDVIVLTEYTLDDDPVIVLDLLRNVLSQKYSKCETQAHSIGIETALADMDVVPLIQPYGDGTTLYIPDRHLQTWVHTNPPFHTQWTSDTNKENNGRFKPLVKLIKWWRRENKTISKRPKGFVLEVFAADHMPSDESHYGEIFVQTLESFVEKHQYDITMQQVPFNSDPAVSENNILDGLSFDAFKGFFNKVKLHASTGRQALNEDDQEKATELWREIFTSFPAPKSNKSNTLLASAALPDLTFPDRAVQPRGPKGFA